MRKLSFFCLVVLGLSVGAIAGCGEEPLPDYVSFERDIKPLMEARCVRCHGAGGTLNNDPDIGLNSAGNPRVPTSFYANIYLDEGGHLGARTNALSINTYVNFSGPTAAARMPPPPAQELTDRELALIERWSKDPRP